MIVLDLQCAQAHRFEAWFASNEAFERQRQAGQISCPHCGSSQVQRLLSAPHVQTSTHRAAPPDPRQLAERIVTALRQAAQQSEDVGTRFAEEARRIHHGAADERPIRGQADREEVRELIAEGIPVLPMPPGKDELH